LNNAVYASFRGALNSIAWLVGRVVNSVEQMLESCHIIANNGIGWQIVPNGWGIVRDGMPSKLVWV
jgi:hypothetical protein